MGHLLDSGRLGVLRTRHRIWVLSTVRAFPAFPLLALASALAQAMGEE